MLSGHEEDEMGMLLDQNRGSFLQGIQNQRDELVRKRLDEIDKWKTEGGWANQRNTDTNLAHERMQKGANETSILTNAANNDALAGVRSADAGATNQKVEFNKEFKPFALAGARQDVATGNYEAFKRKASMGTNPIFQSRQSTDVATPPGTAPLDSYEQDLAQMKPTRFKGANRILRSMMYPVMATDRGFNSFFEQE